MVTSFIALTILANSAFLETSSGFKELCIITVGTTTYEPFVGECKDVIKEVIHQVKRKHPTAVINPVINGNQLNKV
jgi:hypothetical protein